MIIRALLFTIGISSSLQTQLEFGKEFDDPLWFPKLSANDEGSIKVDPNQMRGNRVNADCQRALTTQVLGAQNGQTWALYSKFAFVFTPW